MLLIYAQQISSRLQYVMQLFFNELIKTTYQITNDMEQFESYHGPKLNYSKKKLSNESFILAHDLLFESGIREQKISFGEWNGIKTLFAHDNSSELPFDPFAATFYLVSRYEEYLSFAPDKSGRFPDQKNIAVQNGFHEIPVVNYYALFLKELLQQKFPGFVSQPTWYQFQLTYDIDFAFAYNGKGFLRNAGGFAKSLWKFDLKEFRTRAKVLSGSESDPYDTFDFQFSLHEKFHIKPIYFFLLGDYAKYDKNISWKNSELQSLIKRIAEKYEVGIHSSFASNNHPERVKIESDRLSEITGEKILRNRQHYLKLKLPVTYQTLISNGITEDYTMGFASEVGFRAGIAATFFWYDLSREEITSLRIFPFTVMDATLHYYQKLSSNDAFMKTRSLMNEVKKVSGYFQFLAHNDLLSEKIQWRNWRSNLEELLGEA